LPPPAQPKPHRGRYTRGTAHDLEIAMSASGLDILDRPLQTTNASLDQLRDFNIEVNGFVFWPIMFGLFVILLPLAIRVFG
jgi:hypothetical protein